MRRRLFLSSPRRTPEEDLPLADRRKSSRRLGVPNGRRIGSGEVRGAHESAIREIDGRQLETYAFLCTHPKRKRNRSLEERRDEATSETENPFGMREEGKRDSVPPRTRIERIPNFRIRPTRSARIVPRARVDPSSPREPKRDFFERDPISTTIAEAETSESTDGGTQGLRYTVHVFPCMLHGRLPDLDSSLPSFDRIVSSLFPLFIGEFTKR